MEPEIVTPDSERENIRSVYSHKKKIYNPSISEALGLFNEWLLFWGKKWVIAGYILLVLPFKMLKKTTYPSQMCVGGGEDHAAPNT